MELRAYRRKLPHWRMNDAVYFVTWRLHKGQSGLTPMERTEIVSALKHFNGVRYEILAFAVMDDHVHTVVRPYAGFELEQLLRSWKSFTASLWVKSHRRYGTVWQSEYYDRIIRDERELDEKIGYVLENPFRRWPEIEASAWVGPELSEDDHR